MIGYHLAFKQYRAPHTSHDEVAGVDCASNVIRDAVY